MTEVDESTRNGSTSGSDFYRSSLPRATWRPDRDTYLVELVRGQRVLHVGCTDTPLTTQKLATGDLLHAKLLPTADEIVGLDVDSEALAVLERAIGGRYVHADATDVDAMVPVVDALRPTLILAADVIEHIPDAGRFVRALAATAGRPDPPARVAVSTPNGLSIRTPILALAGNELIHPDHRVVYTPTSLARTLSDAGLAPTEWATYSVTLGPGRLRRAFDLGAHALSRARPFMGDGMIVVAEISRPALAPPA
jgi:2-polyprenyl-3-methyl-5-hydroxy-6-metoxy-1,4-benzoquinol methylase